MDLGRSNGTTRGENTENQHLDAKRVTNKDRDSDVVTDLSITAQSVRQGRLISGNGFER